MPLAGKISFSTLSLVMRRVYHHTPEIKRVSMEWKHLGSPWTRKFKVMKSAGKVMATVFWDQKGVLPVDFLEMEATINAAVYGATLERLWAAIRRKHPGLLSKGVLLLRNNARPHTANATQELLWHFQWGILEHPPCSPDLVPSDYHLFLTLKEHLGGQIFQCKGDVKTAVECCLNT